MSPSKHGLPVRGIPTENGCKSPKTMSRFQASLAAPDAAAPEAGSELPNFTPDYADACFGVDTGPASGCGGRSAAAPVAATASGAAATPAPSFPAVDSTAPIRGVDRAVAVFSSGPSQALARGTPPLRRPRLTQRFRHARSRPRRGRVRARSPAPRPAGRGAVRDPPQPLWRWTRPEARQAPPKRWPRIRSARPSKPTPRTEGAWISVPGRRCHPPTFQRDLAGHHHQEHGVVSFVRQWAHESLYLKPPPNNFTTLGVITRSSCDSGAPLVGFFGVYGSRSLLSAIPAELLSRFSKKFNIKFLELEIMWRFFLLTVKTPFLLRFLGHAVLYKRALLPPWEKLVQLALDLAHQSESAIYADSLWCFGRGHGNSMR